MVIPVSAITSEQGWGKCCDKVSVSNVSDARPVLRASLLPGLASSGRQVLDSALKAGQRKDDWGPLSAFSPVSCLKSNSQSRPGPAVSFCTLIFPRDLRDRVRPCNALLSQVKE